MNFSRSRLAGILVATFLTSAAGHAEQYTDGNLTITWSRVGDDYTGTFLLGGAKYLATAHAVGEQLAGSFQASGTSFDFHGKLRDKTLSLTTGTKTYTLQQSDENPLDNRSASATAFPALPVGYSKANETTSGMVIKASKPQMASVKDALASAIADAGAFLGSKLAVGGAVEDQLTHSSGMVTFTATRGGKAVRGLAACQLAAGGVEVAITVCDADAPRDEWQKLAATQTPVSQAANGVELKPYTFRDGSGTIGIADDWSTQAASFLDPIRVNGPGGAYMAVNASLNISPPDGQLMQLYQQVAEQSRQMGMPPPPPPPGLFASFCTPAEALSKLLPQVNEMNRRNGGPITTITQIISTLPSTTELPNGRAQLMEYTWTLEANGQTTLMHSILRGESATLAQGSWMLFFTELAAPETDFPREQPRMFAMLKSIKPNRQVVDQIQRERNQAFTVEMQQSAADSRAQLNQQFQAGQARHRQQVASYDQHNQAWAAGQNLQARSNDNFIEVIGGTRDIVDTQTGRKSEVDLSDSTAIVNSLNNNDPGRYVEIPLRDKLDPLIQH